MQNQTYLNIQRSRYYWLILIKRTTKGSSLAKIKGISKRNSFSKIKQIVSMVSPLPPFFTLPLTTVSHVIATIFLRLLRSPTTKSWALTHLPGEQVNRQQSRPQGYLCAPITGSWAQDFKWGVGVRSWLCLCSTHLASTRIWVWHQNPHKNNRYGDVHL